MGADAERTFGGVSPPAGWFHRCPSGSGPISVAADTRELPHLPLVGRSDELATLRRALERAAAGRGGTLFLAGPAGIGKTRLAQAIRDEAERRDFQVAVGCAYPMEAGVPYSVFCEVLDPLVREQPSEVLMAWTRGAPEFQLLCPSLATDGSLPPLTGADDVPDLRNRLLWNVPSFLDRLRRERPLLLVLEDLQWADPSSLELLHFLGRRSDEQAVLIIGSFRAEEAGAKADVRELARTLKARADADLLELGPLGPNEVLEVVSRGFDVAPEVVGSFSQALHRWTGGNPFFVRSVLEALIASGRLRKEGGRWVGWSLDEGSAPASILDLVRSRLNALSPPARQLTELAAVVGARARFDLLKESSGMPTADLLGGLNELQAHRILEEGEGEGEVVYAFVHPVVRSVVYQDLGLARTRLYHLELARTLERMHGDAALDRAGELAAHILHASPGAGEIDGARAAAYLAAAGRDALAAHASREAAEYLDAALGHLPPSRDGQDGIPERFPLLVDLAQARQRLGQHDEAERLLLAAREMAEADSDAGALAQVDRLLGLNMFWAGRLDEAVAHWDRGLEEAGSAGDLLTEARIRLDRSVCLQELGRPEEAAADARTALGIGEETGEREIQHGAHRTLALLHTWTGPPGTAREHARQALDLAETLGQELALFWAHRALAIVEGLTGHPADGRRHLNAAVEIAERLGSPLLKLRMADVRIEYCAGLGQWDEGIDLAEESIRMARELNHHIALPRLLVWSGLLHLDRGDHQVARTQITEAWARAGLAEEGKPSSSTHSAIVAHIGKAALHLASGEFEEALAVGEAGLELVERMGSRIWAIHRLLPIMGEAALHLRDLERARQISRQLREESIAFEHRIGIVWADTCDALLTWLDGYVEDGARQMRIAAERLEELDTVPYAARLRRQLAGRLAELGDRDAAIRELRRVHDILSALGAEPELNKARGQFREVGARPPVRGTAPGQGELTPREEEIAHLVGQRKSNKAIGKELGISHRTVGTHLSNIFRKLDVDTRTQLGDLVRTGLLEEGQ
jgi:DNA-binding CsgD family transcriptional regulator